MNATHSIRGRADYLIISESLLAAIENKKIPSVFKELDDSKFTKLSSLINDLQKSDKLIMPESTDASCQRTSLEKLLQDHMQKRKIDSAGVVNSDFKPKRII